MANALLSGELSALEIARGHDGLLRGMPDPVLLVGLYVSDPQNPESILTVGRSLHRFRPTKPFPSSVHADRRDLPSVSFVTGRPLQYHLLVIALEEDGGNDVQSVFGALEYPKALSVWSLDEANADLVPLGAFRSERPSRIDLHLETRALHDVCSSDKCVGACTWIMRPRLPPATSVFRAGMRARDGKNDWTAVLNVHF